MQKSKKKQNWIIGVVAVLTLFAVFSGGNSEDKPSSVPSPTVKVESTPDPVVKEEVNKAVIETPKEEIVPNNDVEVADYFTTFYGYVKAITESQSNLGNLLTNSNVGDSGWTTDVAVEMYLMESNADNINAMKNIPPELKEEHDRFLLEGIIPLKLGVTNLTRGIDRLDPDLITKAEGNLTAYTNAFLHYGNYLADYMENR